MSNPWQDGGTRGVFYLDATLRPNRSLSRRGLRRVMLLALAGFGIMGVSVFMLGGQLLIVHLYLLLALSGLIAAFQLIGKGFVETVRVSALEVSVLRRGQIVWRSPTPFTRVSQDEKERLWLQLSDQRIGIGRQLGAEEREDFAEQLRAAIARARRGEPLAPQTEKRAQ